MRKLGLIGGLATGATIHYYRELAQLGAAEMLIVHADVHRVMKGVTEGDRDGLAAYFSYLIGRLAAGGADVAAISAVAPHICIRELERISVLPIVDVIDAVAEHIHALGLRKVGLIGTRYVMKTHMFGMLGGVEIVVPNEIDTVHEIYMQMTNGVIEGKVRLERIAQSMRVDAVVMAGTDLAVAFDETNTPFPHVACLKVHASAIMRALQTAAGH